MRRNSTSSTGIRISASLFVMIISIMLSLYVGGWLLFIKPIFDCAVAFDAGLLTGVMIAITVFKCFVAPIIGWLIAICGIGIGSAIAGE